MYLVGLKINKVNASKYFEINEYNSDYNDEIINEYEFLYVKDNQKYSKKFAIEEGMCGSGYCGAEWLHESPEERINNFGTLHFIPNISINIDELKTDYGGNELFCIYENDDDYYPGATINIKFNNWTKTNREKDKKQIYVFSGPSAIGKSFIAHKTDLNVYETDIKPLLPENLNKYDIIVIGNKYCFEFSEIKSKLDLELVEIIQVEFKR